MKRSNGHRPDRGWPLWVTPGLAAAVLMFISGACSSTDDSIEGGSVDSLAHSATDPELTSTAPDSAESTMAIETTTTVESSTITAPADRAESTTVTAPTDPVESSTTEQEVPVEVADVAGLIVYWTTDAESAVAAVKRVDGKVVEVVEQLGYVVVEVRYRSDDDLARLISELEADGFRVDRDIVSDDPTTGG